MDDAELVAKEMATAKAAGVLIVQAARENNGAAGAYLVQQLFDRNDVGLWMLTIGYLASRLVSAEGAVPVVGERLEVEPEEKPTGWYVAVNDQLEAAASEGQWQQFAATSVDGMMRAIGEDVDKGMAVDFDHLVAALTTLDHYSLLVFAAECLGRLCGQRSAP